MIMLNCLFPARFANKGSACLFRSAKVRLFLLNTHFLTYQKLFCRYFLRLPDKIQYLFWSLNNVVGIICL